LPLRRRAEHHGGGFDVIGINLLPADWPEPEKRPGPAGLGLASVQNVADGALPQVGQVPTGDGDVRVVVQDGQVAVGTVRS
jgi:hypothetical protein